MTATIASLIPARARRVVYAILGFAAPTITTTVAVLEDGWQSTDLVLILVSAGTSAGFGLAFTQTKD